MVIGEYAGDYGFPLPNPVFTQSGISAIKVSGRVMREAIKNKETWRGALCDLRSRIRYSPESIRWAVALVARHAFRNSDGNLYVRYLYWNGDKRNWNYNWLDNDFGSANTAARLATFFLSLSVMGRVLFY